MARARPTENARTRPKTVLIEEITRGIEQFQDILTSIEDCSREGFPYRDAARAKAELQLRECVRRIFGERSSEFQTCRNYRLRMTSKEETAQSLAIVKSLVQTLEEKKLNLQGVKEPAKEAPTIVSVAAGPATIATMPITDSPGPVHGSLVPRTIIPTVAISVPLAPAEPSRPIADASMLIPPMIAPPLPSPTAETAAAIVASAEPNGHGLSSPECSPRSSEGTPAVPTREESAPSIAVSATNRPRPQPVDDNGATSTDPEASRTTPMPPPPPPTPLKDPPGSVSTLDVAATVSEPDALERLRKVCLRFHAVARQLRLRKDYRATLEVEDDYDLQDLLCALLKVEFDEVGSEEWTPTYAGGASRTAFLLHGDRIAVVAKKTRAGLTATDLASEVTADSARYTSRDQCRTLFCFIYDPEGRIGSPKRLETDLTSVSDRYMIDVLVAPK